MNASSFRRRRPPSLRRWSLIVAVLAACAVIAATALLGVWATNAVRTAERIQSQSARSLVDEIRAVAAIERLIVLGDQLGGGISHDVWQPAGLAMQALAYHPVFSALPERQSSVRDTYAVAEDVMRLHRHAEENPGERAATRKKALERWQLHRQRLQGIVDASATSIARDTGALAADTGDLGRLLLGLSIGGGLGLLFLIALAFALVRGHLLQPVLGLSRYVADLRRGIRDDAALPRPVSREVVDLREAMLELATAQDALRQLALYDSVTGLVNRSALSARAEQALADAHRQHAGMALLLIDLDEFKSINDTLGHDAGDQYLCEIASRIAAILAEGDTLARLGGDEFAILLGAGARPETAAATADALQRAVRQPVRLGEQVLALTASVGISVYPSDGKDLGTLLRHADLAMYAAKARGRGQRAFYNAAMNDSTRVRLEVEQALHAAIEAEAFTLHFQPQIDAATGRVRAFEALVRWPQADGSMLPPDRFIPIAEETGMIVALGEWVLRRACETLAQWQAAGLVDVRMAVNLSARQLADTRLLAQTRYILANSGIPAGLLELEVTETAAMQHPERTIEILRLLHSLGVSLAIDDFGTGYSSLAYLKLFPLDRLKLDRTFVKDIETDLNDAAICEATIRLAHSLSLEVVAEGVETGAQQSFLTGQGCDLLQGYHFSRPLPADAALAFALQTNVAA